MKNVVLIFVSFFVMSCTKVSNKPVSFNTISFEWIGNMDKPLYKLILCVDCISEKDFLLRKIKISEVSMKEINAIGFDNNQIKIDNKNKEVIIKKLIQIDKILDNDLCSQEDRDDVKIFIKRIP
ncbi:hypothetical protein NU10_01585 [Flavobacterium dauae]|uniref:hypothetical protein n=1 Tax=Flavobacterium dauae TaxID=1563479 RepID=UPI00101CB0CB|nr:hypothetical protein [Flavobacterium dauae]WLD24112.1 hypothetical protein NU10_01585 [Flavobacterium dauae]